MTVKPGTEIETVLPYVNELDMVLIMSVEPGFGGQRLIEASLTKARKLRDYVSENNISLDIEMDGGIYLGNAAEVAAAGVNVIVAGSAVFCAENIGDAVQAFFDEMR
jgi:ribulose-phosphate 3-epimerase